MLKPTSDSFNLPKRTAMVLVQGGNAMNDIAIFEAAIDRMGRNELRAASDRYESRLSYCERYAAAEASMVEDIMSLILAGDMNAPAPFFKSLGGTGVASDWKGSERVYRPAVLSDVIRDVIEYQDFAVRLISLMSKCARLGFGIAQEDIRTEARTLALAMAAEYASQNVEVSDE